MPKRKINLGAGDLILNSPFEEPGAYWSYDRKYRIFTQMEGRRPAGYVVATPDAQGFDDPGQFIELDLVSDFGSNDAIESGLVKTPRVVVRDNGRLTPEYKSRFYHLYRDPPDVTDDFNRKAEPHEPLPDIVTHAYTLLGQHWLETKRDWESVGHPVPPVLITVANRIETAARIEFAFEREKIPIDELCDQEGLLRIDSKALGLAESQEEAVDLGFEQNSDDDDDGPQVKLTKQQEFELLRRKVDTVGQVGALGEQLRNLISVGMLSEGWDANTVTHIMGLRAFSSQLLCEQVVGRGLRRTSCDINPESGKFEPEYVNIFGVAGRAGCGRSADRQTSTKDGRTAG